MRKYATPLNIVYGVQLIVVLCIAIGFIPPDAALFLGGLIAFFLIISPLETGIIFFARSVPFFIALPIAEQFDSFNIWRIAALILFLKWFFNSRKSISLFPRKFPEKISVIEIAFAVLALSAVLSVYVAPDRIAAIRRIFYFANAGIIFYLVRAVVRGGRLSWQEIGHNFVISGIIVVMIGFAQLAMTYAMTIYDFSDFWTQKVARGLYGTEWSERAMRGNTWFAYFYHAIKLRMFSSFTSSHTFALYLLLTMPYFLVLGFRSYSISPERRPYIEKCAQGIMIALFFLALILSGTRGIWLAAAFPFFAAFYFFLASAQFRSYSKRVAAVFALLFILILPASYIYSSPQFQIVIGQEDALLLERFSSIIDFGETSNKGRIIIWKQTLRSIKELPLTGIGIGNYPLVLHQDIDLAKSGSSAHNAYLQIACEMGIIAGIAFIAFLLAILYAARTLMGSNILNVSYMGTALALGYLWLYAYNITDSSFFDERVLLGFFLSAGIAQGMKEKGVEEVESMSDSCSPIIEKGLISVQLVVRNEAHRIRECLIQVIGQTYPHIEVFVLDNASEDETRDIIKREFPSVQCRESKKNVGFGGGHNRLLPFTCGEYVIALSADVILDKNFCSEAVNCARNDSKIGAIQGKSVRGKDIRARLKHLDSTGFQIFRSRRLINRGHGEIDHGQYETPEEIFAFDGAAAFFRRDALEDARINGELYDEDLFWYATDIDIGWRLRILGWKNFYCPRAFFYHDRPTTERLSKGKRDFILLRKRIPLLKRQLEYRNLQLVRIKYDFLRHVLRDFVLIMWRDFRFLAYLAVFEPKTLYIVPSFICRIPRIFHKRLIVMRRRKTSPEEMGKWFI